VAAALKYHYSIAAAADLGWMLRPVSLLLELVTAQNFIQSPAGEWYSTEAGIVLVKACAGVNFMLMSFVGWCWLLQPAAGSTRASIFLRRFLLALALAWLAAVMVNVLRIVLAESLGPWLAGAMGTGGAHRLIGLLVYLPALTAQLLLAGRARRGAAVAVAASLYLALMLATPLLTGNAWWDPAAFAAHALTLTLVLLPLLAWGLYRHRRP
jgi:exosortase K